MTPGPRSTRRRTTAGHGRSHLPAHECRTALSIAALVLTLIAALLLPAQASAVDPFRLSSQIEDRAGVLGDRAGEVQAAIESLQDTERVQLWVTYVDTFSGMGSQEWADQTATTSDLGLRDVLLAVVVGDRAYAYSVDQDFPLTQAELDEVMAVAVEPALIENDWAGASVGAAAGLGQALRGETVTTPPIQPGPPYEGSGEGQPAAEPQGVPYAFIVLVVLAIVVIAVLVVSMLVRRSRRRRGEPAPGAVGASSVPLAELRRRANAELVETDDAIKTSTEELGFAVAQFGEEQAAPFKTALDEAQLELGEAFKLRKELDEATDDGVRRELLTAILQRTSAANAALDAQAERFDRLRDLERTAPDVLSALERQLSELEERRPQVAQELAELAAGYAPSALQSVVTAPDQAAALVAFARDQAAAGLEDVAAGRSGEAAVTALAAEEATGQARTLLDAVGRLRRDLEDARSRIDEAVAETYRDIAEAQAAGAGERLAPLIGTAQAAVAAAADAASPQGGRDPLAALRYVEEADGALEQALVQVRGEQEQRAKAAAALERSAMAARAEIASASDFITTNRGAIGSGPRTLLAEAQRSLDQAAALAGSDPVSAAQYAAQAHQLASRASSDAQAEARQAAGAQGMGGAPAMGGGGMGGMGGAILGGILVSMMSGGGGRGFSGGGFGGGGRRGGGGGFAPPSFGGGGTRMRRGGGGRF